MSTPLPEHDHCKFCGDPVPFDQAYCSEKCYWDEHARVKKEKNKNMLFGAIVAVCVVAIFVASRLLR